MQQTDEYAPWTHPRLLGREASFCIFFLGNKTPCKKPRTAVLLHTLLLLLDRVHGQGGRDTHTHTAASNGGGSGGNVWLVWGPSLAVVVAVSVFCCCSTRPTFLSLERERERAESHTTTGVCCTHHTARAGREQGVPYTTAAVSCRRRKREERYWLVGSLWVHRLVCSRRREHLPCRAEAGGGTHHTTHQQQRSFLENGVLLTAVLCTSLHSLWARGCVASAAAVAVKRWWKLEASCSNSSSSSGTRPADIPLFFPTNVIFSFFLSSLLRWIAPPFSS